MDVSVEGLKSVKEALKIFKLQVENIGRQTVLHSQKYIEECERCIHKVKIKVEELKKETKEIIQLIQNLEEQLISIDDELQQINTKLQQLEQQLQSLKMKLAELYSILAGLQAQLSSSKNNEENQQIQGQINAIQNQINTLQNSIQNIEHQINENRDKKEQINENKNKYFLEKERCDEKLSIVRKKLNKYQQKLEQLNVINKNVQVDFEAYIQTIKKFENSSIESANDKHKVIDECINLIEEMESIL